ncbi:MAG: Ig-like domain-containing protein [Cyclobacteriaceae bacterium]|nr:Ig-like domain-containing protein [Cyclobacteriaceae bacterium]
MRTKCLIFFTLALASCIGTDYIDDPIVGERVDVDSNRIVLLPGGFIQLHGMYYNQYGIKQSVELLWTSSNASVASVNSEGVITAHAGGQAIVRASYGSVQSTDVNVTVVLDENDVASVEISSAKTKIGLGEMVMLASTVTNITGNKLTDRNIEWFSENAQIASIDQDGNVTGILGGVVDLHAKVYGVKSNTVTLTVEVVRTGTFVSAGGYRAIGTATMENENNKLVLRFSSNFQTSYALGTFVYLANSTNAAAVKSNGLEISQISQDGEKTFIITDNFPTVNLYDYRYVVILCKPATVTFGYADLN